MLHIFSKNITQEVVTWFFQYNPETKVKSAESQDQSKHAYQNLRSKLCCLALFISDELCVLTFPTKTDIEQGSVAWFLVFVIQTF
jgi:hypothetical protein